MHCSVSKLDCSVSELDECWSVISSDVFSNSVLLVVFCSQCLQILGLGMVCSSYQWIGDTMWESLSRTT